jgi:hypothetical protein
MSLGIGTIKVEALGRWATCSRLIVPGGPGHRLSALGRIVFQLDPSLEESGTWWIIHEGLTRQHEPWGWYTCEFLKSAFSLEELDEAMKAAFGVRSERAVKNARRALVLAMTRTPLGPELGLMVETSEGRFERSAADLASLNPALFGYAVMRWARADDRLTANIDELLEGRAPAVVLGLSRSATELLLAQIDDNYRGEVLSLSRTAGLNSVAFGVETQPLHLVEAYYLEQLEGREPFAALQHARTEGLSARSLAQAESETHADG